MDDSNLTQSRCIDADALEPVRKGYRFQLTPRMLGRLEHLAKARFEVRPFGRGEMDDWRRLSVEDCHALAQSVNASSQIEVAIPGSGYNVMTLAQRDWFGESEDLTPWVDYYINAIYTQYLRAYQRVIDEQHYKR